MEGSLTFYLNDEKVIQELENKIESQEEFKKKITWTFAIVVTVALILEYFVNIYCFKVEFIVQI